MRRFQRQDHEPVLPVSDYCNALYEWLELVQKVAQEQPGRYPDFDKIAEVAPRLTLSIEKSNYLLRRIYMGEPHRTEPCPIHKGKWSGWKLEPCPAGCSSDLNITGWLPPSEGNPSK